MSKCSTTRTTSLRLPAYAGGAFSRPAAVSGSVGEQLQLCHLSAEMDGSKFYLGHFKAPTLSQRQLLTVSLFGFTLI